MRNYHYEYKNDKETDDDGAAGWCGCCAAGDGVCGGAGGACGGIAQGGAHGAGAEGDAGGDSGGAGCGADGAV